MNLPTKLALTTVSLSSVIGVGYLGNATKSKIKNLIDDKYDFILLNTQIGANNKEQIIWATNWANYKTDNKDVFKLDGWVSGDENLNLIEVLKSKCEELSKKEVVTLYENITKYCGRLVTFKDQAENEKFEILVTGIPNKHLNAWLNRFDNQTKLTEELQKLEITNIDTIDKIKEGCEKEKSLNKTKENYEKIYKAYQKICTKQKEDSK